MIKAVNEYVIIEEIKNDKPSYWLEIPDQKEKPWRGKVISMGKIECDINIGDIVYFAKYAPTEIEFEWKTYLTLQEKSLICKEENNG